MKAILVIDMPTSCEECPCYHEGYGHCNNVKFRFIQDSDKVAHWCPLKPMPSKRKSPITKTFGTPFNKGQAKGWNDCIDEILGEQNAV